MTRSDWISLSVALVGTAISYYLGGARTALYCGIIGAAIFVVVVILSTRRKDIEPIPTQVSRQTANPVISHNASPTINVNVGTQSPNVQQEAALRQLARPNPLPNVKFVESKSVDVYVTQDLFRETQNGLGNFRAAVLRFRNDGILGQPVQQPDLRAHVIYRDSQGAEVTDIPRGVWLEERGGHVVFTVGEKRSLIVFLLSSQGTLKKLWKEPYYHEYSWMGTGEPSYRVRDERISGQVAKVEVRFLTESSGTCLMQVTFDVQIGSGDALPTLVLSASAGE